MKNSSLYAQRIGQIYRMLKRKYGKVEPPVHDEPADAVVAGIVSQGLGLKSSKVAVKRLFRHFVDLNDLRVSRPEEITEVLGGDSPEARQTAAAITKALGLIFDKYNTVSLQCLKKGGKKAARDSLQKIDDLNGFVIDYCMVTSLKAHAVPLTGDMLQFMRSNELVDPEAEDAEIENFMARQVTSAHAYEFYELMRRGCEHGGKTLMKKVRSAGRGKSKTEPRKKK